MQIIDTYVAGIYLLNLPHILIIKPFRADYSLVHLPI